MRAEIGAHFFSKIITMLHSVNIGPYATTNNLFVAPMAGVTDRPFRQLCKEFGAGYAVSEMTAANPKLWGTDKFARRVNHAGEAAPRAVQIAGSDPQMLADATRYNIDKGAQIIDINMGCPAKKVCQIAAGSALLRDELLVARLLEAVVQAAQQSSVAVPVTLKTRTGWSRDQKNALRIAHIAQESGIALLTLHGRTRCDFYNGQAEYDTIAEVKSRARIPVVANGDIDSPAKAAWVLKKTGADALMIGRAAQGRPWIFREMAHYLQTGYDLPPPSVAEAKQALLDHLQMHYTFYGEWTGLRTARKHIGWYVRDLPGGAWFRARMNTLNDCVAQHRAVAEYFDQLGSSEEPLNYFSSMEQREAA